VRKDGSIVFANLSVGCVRRAGGQVDYTLALLEDITERKRVEENNRKLNEALRLRAHALEIANKELESFSYLISHNLRTPLRAMAGFSGILLNDYAGNFDDEGKRLLNVVRNNTARMGTLIDDILKFIRTGRQEMRISEVDMETLACDILAETTLAADGRHPQVDIGPLPHARGDMSMLRQVFANLLSNAIKFSRPKPASRIEIGGHINGDEAVYFVKDNGVGFDMKYAGKLFGAFQRLHGVDEFEGTGIGLAIVKRIVGRHGGRAWAEGEPGEGATIYFALPAGGAVTDEAAKNRGQSRTRRYPSARP
jgi:light-regulated signal transduction histidine kinase (bacteriophytochrome)